MVEDVSPGKLFATVLLHMPYCEKFIFGKHPTAKSTQRVGPRPKTKISLKMFQYLLHLCLQTEKGKQ